MPEALDRYWDKRDFRVTPEPRGTARKAGKALSFVVQKHAARRLHYDFRLELGGTLKSWAVPKGPSFDPHDKRMAVHVEDHPLAYASFEGVIPPKQYGAGTVIVWDRGTWTPIGDPEAGYRAGKLKFFLDGEKLHGAWTLVRMRGRGNERQEPWLLIKERDEAARPASEFSVVDELPDSVLSGPAAAARSTAARATMADGHQAARKTARRAAPAEDDRPAPARRKAPSAASLPEAAVPATLPLTLSPQLATLVDQAPESGDYIYEAKLDGYRLLTRIDGRDVRLFTRNGNDWTAKMKSLAAALAKLKLPSAWLDGEIVVLNEAGVPDFNALQNAFDQSRTEQIQYFLFDLPYYDGHDLRRVPLWQRRELLARLLEAGPSERLRFSQDFQATGSEMLQSACRLRLEGVIGKKRDAAYVSRRSPTWIKLKCTQRQEFVIGGYTEPKGSRSGLGSLLLGIHDEAGELRYAGNVGTGFDSATLKALRARLEALETQRTPFAGKPREARGRWVQPELVAEVSFSEWTPDGRIRHSVFHGLRGDKPAQVITKEVPMPAADAEQAAAPAAKSARRSAGRRAVKPPPDLPGDLRITHPERVIDPSSGATKLDLVHHYLRVAEVMLPHLARRPVALVRAPSGIGGQLFFQKHGDTLKIAGIKQLPPELDPSRDPLLEIDSVEALIGAAQMNVIELHTWNATSRAIEKPDRMTFDLDPGEGVGWSQVQEGAQLTRTILDELRLRSFLKTSGGKGLHVVVPLSPRHDWDTVKGFSQAVVQHLARVVPSRFVAKSGPRNRVGKIFVDYLRNGRGATTAAAFSARARPGMGVSVPCAWDELDELESGAHWNIFTVHERLALDPWADYGTTRQTLTAAMKALGFS
ncbi:DNA ligase D [Aquabacterium sp. A7-Y]|uniref:DNA ligase D n=1 Tax=Aquabacterium sp. A7-Y TaxID=1349605 RepID=UPI00223D6D53|nr:DNA ligase D [Aquabacterium sp. A7-Y]MCW7537838.1 DNA ligase D [Aquabacterium sp. A7-Y]